MTEGWGLRQLFVKNKERRAGRSAAETSAALIGMLEAGYFKIDLDKRTVTLRGQELRLTSKEFEVLVFLTGHPQSTVTPQFLRARSWISNRLRQTDFLRSLTSLRKKLNAVEPGQRYLRTELCLIYRFDPSSSTAV